MNSRRDALRARVLLGKLADLTARIEDWRQAEILTLPLHPFLSEMAMEEVARRVRSWLA